MAKEITLQGRAFRVRPFKAKAGSFIAFKVAGLLGPLFAQAAGTDPKALQDAQVAVNLLPALGAITQGLSEEEFQNIQDKCLDCVDEQLPSGWVPIVQAGGVAFAVPDLDENAPLILSLTIQTLTANLSGFFAEGGLSALLGGLSLSPPSSPPT